MNLKDFFRLFHKNKQTANAPLEKIPWNEVVKECYNKGLNYIYPVVKIIYSDDKTKRAAILQKPDMSYTISFEKLYPYDDDELKYFFNGLHGYWSHDDSSMNSIIDTEENAVIAVFSEPPFKYNKCVIWADCSFRISAEKLWWIKDDGADDPDDLCLHGHVVAKIGEEILEYDATVSAAGLYLLRTLTETHIIHENQAMLPCCGHSMFANDDLSSVDIGVCSNGIDWTVIHEEGRVKLITEAGNETFVDMDDYRDEVCSFADTVEAFYRKCSPKNIPTYEYAHNGYTAFWNEWNRCRK